eukprot:2510888-Alexandrium_andersonii.AAC.1
MEDDSATAACSSATTMSIFARSAETTSLEDLLATHAPEEVQAANADALGTSSGTSSAAAPMEGSPKPGGGGRKKDLATL